MYVIAGLGNPGLSYRKTRHNIGFQALDVLAEGLKCKVKEKAFSGLTGEAQLMGERVLLVKPQTYMNLSGDCIGQILRYYKVPPEKLIVLLDDIELPVGSLRIRAKGSAGTHNGLRSIIGCIGSESFPRIRIGAGQDTSLQLRDYVLKRPGKAEQALLQEAYENAAEAVGLIVSGRIEEAQGKFNKRHEKAEE